MLEKENKSKGYIKEAFLFLLCKKPLPKINVTDVINKAGVARATFYRYFDSIDQLFNSIVDSLQVTLGNNLYVIVKLDDVNKAKLLLKKMLTNINTNKKFFSKVLRENFYMLFEKMHAPAYINELLVSKVITTNELRYIYLARAGILDMFMKDYILHKCSADIDQTVEIIIDKLKQIH